MSFDPKTPITDFNGRTFNEAGALWEASDGKEKLTAGRVVTVALNNGAMEEKDFAKAMERYELMKRIETAEGAIELKAAEITLIQKLLPTLWSPLFVGRVNELLEPGEQAKAGGKLKKAASLPAS